jgi:plasmid stability protein
MTHEFTREYVSGLRREGQRKGLRIRNLEEWLIIKAIAEEAARHGIYAPEAMKIMTAGLSVDECGKVLGVADAVRKYKETSR